MKPVLVFVLFLAAAAAITLPKKDNDFSSRVTGGQSAIPYAHPFVIAVELALTEVHKQQFCAGTLIHTNWVLSAASCFDDLPIIGRLEVCSGLYELTNRTFSQHREVASISMHPDYRGGVSPNDIAMLNVEEPFEIDLYTQPIRLPQPNTIHYGYVTLFGWGDTSTTDTPNFPENLQAVVMPILSYVECYQHLRGRTPLEVTNMCTGPLLGGISHCTGDAGGPLTQQNEVGEYEIVGISSWGFTPCGAFGAPSIYTRVSAFNAWILNQMT
ncbi:lectizyme-like [Phlebotomus argentipes]|uniref:lectizyme-like n=1 Tax=Phlebotomus argentipes TaxID=94469 RepID=UPI002892C4E8|nr:lectizyme-like [Phlebotomus argentipes]